MENILVTGGCGFIGANFIRYLLEKSNFKGRIINVDKLTYAGNLENLDGRCELPNIEAVRMICDLADDRAPDHDIGSRRNLISFVKDRPRHDRRYAIDFSKLEKEMQWTPKESFQTGLKKRSTGI